MSNFITFNCMWLLIMAEEAKRENKEGGSSSRKKIVECINLMPLYETLVLLPLSIN